MSDADPRPIMHRSFDQAAQVVSGVTPEQLQLATPCTEFDVAGLLTHLVGVGGRIASLGRGEPQANALTVPEGIGDDEWAAAFDATRKEAYSSWADGEVLERKLELPFGSFTGAVVAQIYTLELTTHTWDLASATGQLGALDPDLAEASLAVAQEMLPPEPRGGFIPFEAVIPVPDDAAAYDRLAGFLGRPVD
ncbi:MAG: TIGR03086 family metal-binding protein [Actinomycetota bacterium]|nr:TIGR03086 family metal-binding protein [Actinomycetota bacterium]MDQ6947276.1 TIGR03086 family metal-binding protein [Actinomycetota bacterium]